MKPDLAPMAADAGDPQPEAQGGHILWRALSSSIVFFSCMQLSIQGLSGCGVPVNAAAAWLCIALAGGVAVWFWRGGRPDAARMAWPAALKILAGAALFFFLLMVLVAVLRPDISWDGSAYHLPTMHFWLREQRVHWISLPRMPIWLSEFMNGYPKGVELLGFLIVSATGSTALSNTINLPLLVLGVLGAACMARALGARPAWALGAGVLWTWVPVNVSQSATTYVDSGFASCAVALWGVFSHVVIHRRHGWREMVAFGGAAGLALGGKSTGVVIAGATFALLGAVLFWRGIDKMKSAHTLLMNARAIALAAAVAVLVGGGWYLRNWVRTGSPIYPMGISIAGKTVFPGESSDVRLPASVIDPPEMQGLSRPRQIWMAWTHSGPRWPQSLVQYDSKHGGLGSAWLLGGLPGIVAMLGALFLRRFRTKDRVLLFALLNTAVWTAFLLTPLNWWARYTLWIAGPGLACFAVVLSWMAARREWRVLACAWFGGCAALAMLEGLVVLCSISCQDRIGQNAYAMWRQNPACPVLLSTWRGEPWVLEIEEGSLLKQVLRDTRAKVLAGPLKEHRLLLLGELCKPLGERPIAFTGDRMNFRGIDFYPPIPDEEIIRIVRDEQPRYLLWDANVPYPAQLDAMAVNRGMAYACRVFEFGEWR